jgi:hypothetical protein
MMKKLLLIFTLLSRVLFGQIEADWDDRMTYMNFGVPDTLFAGTINTVGGSFLVTADGDTFKIDMGTALYPLDLEINNVRAFAVDSTGNVRQMGASPDYQFVDTSTDDNDVGAFFSVDATATGTGAEDVDFSIYQQTAGTSNRVMFFDADQGIWLYPSGSTDDLVSFTSSGATFSAGVAADLDFNGNYLLNDQTYC